MAKKQNNETPPTKEQKVASNIGASDKHVYKRATTSFDAAGVKYSPVSKTNSQTDSVGVPTADVRKSYTGRVGLAPADTKSGSTGKIGLADADTRKGFTGRVGLSFADTRKGHTGKITLAASDTKTGRTGKITLEDAKRLDPKELNPVESIFLAEKSSKFGIFSSIGNIFYALGFAGEYKMRQLMRMFLSIGAFFAQLLVWIFSSIFAWVAQALYTVWRGFTAGFRHFFRRRKQLRRVRRRLRMRGYTGDNKALSRTFFYLGAKSTVRLVASILGIVLPLLATLVFVLTVQNVINMQYALAVELNGRVLGYVADQSVVENAKSLLRGRIQLASNQSVTDWQIEPSYTIARVNSFTTTPQLVNEILLSHESPDDLVQATGLYIEGELYAVTTEGERLRVFLDELLAERAQGIDPSAEVGFTQDVVCQPNENDVFFASSVRDYEELIQELSADVSQAQWYNTAPGESVLEVAEKNGITTEALRALNPQVAELSDEDIIEQTLRLLVQNAQPFLQVQATFRASAVESIPFETVEVETDERALGARVQVQEGVDGSQQVWYDMVYVDGVLQSRELVQGMTEILQAPVDSIVEIGTYEFSNANIGDDGGPYLFPVPSSTWSSRGMSSYHRAIDINGEVGAPVYASNGGIVVTAGWHWSYGWHVVIDHPDGLTTLYAHNTSLAVQAGQVVKRGDYIAALGSTGNSTGPHVHMEVRRGSEYLDPLDYIVPPEGYTLNMG